MKINGDGKAIRIFFNNSFFSRLGFATIASRLAISWLKSDSMSHIAHRPDIFPSLRNDFDFVWRRLVCRTLTLSVSKT